MRSLPPEERKGNSGNPPAKQKQLVNVLWETPACPESVNLPELWDAIWELGGPTGVFEPVADFHLIKRYCELVDRRERIQREIEVSGWTDIGSKGQTIMNPLARVLSDIEAKLVPLEDRLGLNPQARHTIQIGARQAAEASTGLAQWLINTQ